MLLSAGHAICAAVRLLLAPVASCWLWYVLLCLLAHAACWPQLLVGLCACRPMLFSAGHAMCLLAHAAYCLLCYVLLCAYWPMLLSAGLAMCCYVFVGPCCLVPVALRVGFFNTL